MEQQPQRTALSGLQIIGIVVAAMLITMVVTLLIAKAWLFPSPFKPVVLSPTEEKQLELKLAQFDRIGTPSTPATEQVNGTPSPVPTMEPEPYNEEGASREIKLTEREINAMVAKNTDLADKMAIDFADNLVSIKMLIPMDPDFPLLGGKILKVRAGAEVDFRENMPVFVLRGVSIMGVPLPNAWLGNLKNLDLVKVFGSEPGFWRSFAAGVAAIQVQEGNLQITLKE
ncbi:arginine N-succinyltransferase [Desulfofustis limnaeus]|jgi:plasmid maintenance system antidote protein VapI|uniref:Arginine N-succinyltransferase n=1 Tax=Desulfofustis limnaeus TaxID=2740163 RepID=A0ABM7W5M9_9BACT|nr:arginine N-succinyltransferase [Desulfofustis limnaeus]MDX9895429.1 arginine N-succinyltransferase [Desulfofustis sp.]BDD86192.1 hypothetical protein DPPLL_05570 [Desulfofustis limnaeus]